MSKPRPTRILYCCGCAADVEARLTNGAEIYPHRPDLHAQPFWKCGACGNYVGCHWRTADRTRPLGNIPTAELRNARQHIHRILDPLWKGKKRSRRQLYEAIGARIGREYHTAELRSVEEAREVYRIVQELARAS